MKMKLVTVAICSLLAFTACKKENTTVAPNPQVITIVPQSAVPAAIVSSFTTSFPVATEIEWHRNNGVFEVEFNHQGQRHESSFDDNGHQTSHSISCISAAVPAVVLNAFRARYPSDNVYEWTLKNDGSWQAHFYRSTVKWEASFSATGVFIKEEHL